MLLPSVAVETTVPFLNFCLDLCQGFSIMLWTVGGGVCTMFVVEFLPCSSDFSYSLLFFFFSFIAVLLKK